MDVCPVRFSFESAFHKTSKGKLVLTVLTASLQPLAMLGIDSLHMPRRATRHMMRNCAGVNPASSIWRGINGRLSPMHLHPFQKFPAFGG
jgi:hypothetical protein